MFNTTTEGKIPRILGKISRMVFTSISLLTDAAPSAIFCIQSDNHYFSIAFTSVIMPWWLSFGSVSLEVRVTFPALSFVENVPE